MPSLTEGPQQPGSVDAEQALLWEELQAPFYQEGSRAVARAVFSELGMWAVVGGTRPMATTDRLVHIISSVSGQGLRFTINWQLDGAAQTEALINGKLLDPAENMSEPELYEYLVRLRYFLRGVAFTAERSEVMARRLRLENRADRQFTPGAVYEEYPELSKWRKFYLHTWNTWESVKEES